MAHPDSFGARSTLPVGGRELEIFRLDALQARYDVARLPYTLRILLENVLRREDGVTVTARDVEAVAGWSAAADPSQEISYNPSRVLLQDFTGVPAVVDLAAMRAAMADLGGDPQKINPLIPVELVIDHSVQVDDFATRFSIERNSELEFKRNRERYAFLRWGQGAFANFKAVPPNTGICHQVNLEFLARVIEERDGQAFPDTVVGTDSHTTMVNGLGVLGWGVGGIEAEAAMLGQPISMLIPEVIGFRLDGKLAEGATATDLVLTVTEMLRKKGVVGKFVEFYGPGIADLTLADRATIANMAPEYGATCGIFPIDAETIRYLKATGRSAATIALVEAYAKKQGIWHTSRTPEPVFTDTLRLDVSTVTPSIAGPRRPQDRVALTNAAPAFRKALTETFQRPIGAERIAVDGANHDLGDGDIVIAAITSCTNTSNPSVMLGAGLVAEKAVARGLRVKPWVKTSLAPGSQVVSDYLAKAGLSKALDKLGFNLVGYGCTTCIGNSGPLPDPIADAVTKGDLVAVSVLSGNRNFEGRINPHVRANYLASPMLVVAYAIAGNMGVDLVHDPLGEDQKGKPVYLRDIWPTNREIEAAIRKAVNATMFRTRYADVFKGDARWRRTPVAKGLTYNWEPDSTYVRNPPYFENMTPQPAPLADVVAARPLAILGDSITTDHISPAGSIKKDSPAGRYLIEHGVTVADFNSYGARRGNHEVMMRGTFANIRLRNEMVPGV